MDINNYIESGILELYALGLLSSSEVKEVDRLLKKYDVLAQELDKIYLALEKYAQMNAVEPRAGLEQELLDRIEHANREEKMDPLNLPMISEHSDFNRWDAFVAPMMKDMKMHQQRAIKVLTQTEDLTQLLLISASDFEWETHDDEYESFLILSGQALCTLGERTTLMSRGDYMNIPLHVPHSVQLISPTVTAILQRQKAG